MKITEFIFPTTDAKAPLFKLLLFLSFLKQTVMILLGLSIAPGLRYLFLGLLIAVFFHDTFDFFIFLQANESINSYVSDGLLFVGAIVSYFIAIILSRKHIRLRQQLSKIFFKPVQHV